MNLLGGAGVVTLLVALAGFAGWRVLVRRTGDPLLGVVGGGLTDVEWSDDGLAASGTIRIENRGTALGVVRRVDGHVVRGGTGSVKATLAGSRPPERGWWVSNFLDPGESCVAEIDVVLDGPPAGPIAIELTIQELGRRLFQYRSATVAVPRRHDQA